MSFIRDTDQGDWLCGIGNPRSSSPCFFLVLSLILAGCSLTGTEGDPYSAGQKARTEFDQATEKAGDFVAGSAARPRCRSWRLGWSSCCGEPSRTDCAACRAQKGHPMDKRSPRSRRETLFILAVGIVGALLAALVMTWYLNRENRWFRLVSPPGETPAQIVALDRKLSPYVRTQQGNLFLCSGHTWRDACRPVTAAELPRHRAASAMEHVRKGSAATTRCARGCRRFGRGRALLRSLHLQQNRHPGRRQPVAVAPDLLVGEPVCVGDGHHPGAASGSRDRALSRQAEPGLARPVRSWPGDDLMITTETRRARSFI